jgi:polysaccharide deacetylase 2 family uncharacterized protein YibQ
VAADDLSAPLGQGKAPKRPSVLPRAVPQAIVGLLSLFVVLVAGWAMVADNPFGGEPMAIVPTNLVASAGPGMKKPEDLSSTPGTRPAQQAHQRPNRYDGPSDETTPDATPAPAGRTITIIDGTSGRRQDVVIPGSGDNQSAGIDPRVSEASPNGPLPRIADNGARPSEIYARPTKPLPGKANAPRIAIVVGGLGIGSGVTAEAMGRLPGPVTLSFAPYGGGLEQLAARARNDGHEVLLQVPMEPFDYPDNDPGPQTLLTSLEPEQNVERLQWLLSRFQGYVGVANLMGARFTASETALAPVLREIGKRGLLFVDDGSSQRSVTNQVAAAYNITYARADLAIDAVPAPGDVERALGRLETIARERGAAIGVASALPVSIERIAKWAKAAEGRGIQLVPISAVAKGPGDKSAADKAAADNRRQTSENKR